MNTFIGVDLGWYGKPSGLASIGLDGFELRLRNIGRLDSVDKIMDWIEAEARRGSAVVAVDAPLVIRNQTGIRPAERELNRDFRRFHAGCHPANLSRPFAQNVISFSRRLESLGFEHGTSIKPSQRGRFQIEVHPHAATVKLFRLDRIVKYKRGSRDHRARELRRLAGLILSLFPDMDPATLPQPPRTGSLKSAEDQLDAILCAYIAAHWWRWATKRNRVYGNRDEGYIVVPTVQALRGSSSLAARARASGQCSVALANQRRSTRDNRASQKR